MTTTPDLPPGGKIITNFETEGWTEPAADPASLPADLPKVADPIDEATFRSERAKRIFAVGRWSGVIAVTEMVDGYDAAMKVVEAGPEQFMPDDDEWAPDRVVRSVGIAINFIEKGENP